MAMIPRPRQHVQAVERRPSLPIGSESRVTIRSSSASTPTAGMPPYATPNGTPVATPNGAVSVKSFAAGPLESRLDALVGREGLLQLAISQLFRMVAGRQFGLDFAGLKTLREVVARELGVPEQALGSCGEDKELTRFDLDGDGLLSENECFRLMECYLNEYTRVHRAPLKLSDISRRTMTEAGYTSGKEIGQGSQGVIRLATDKDGVQHCIKFIKKSEQNATKLNGLREEIDVMHRLSSQRVAKTLEIFQDSDYYYWVNEPYFGGDFTTLRSRASTRHFGVGFSDSWCRTVFTQCLEGLDFLHCKSVIHCDIKESNLMLKTDNYYSPEVVIIDFGIAQSFASSRKECCGTQGYMPPEVWEAHKWFPKGDCFSLGVVMLQLLIDQVPQSSHGPDGNNAKKGIFTEGTSGVEEVATATRTREPPFERLPPSFMQMRWLLARMLEKKLEARATSRQALADPWFGRAGASAASETRVRATLAADGRSPRTPRRAALSSLCGQVARHRVTCASASPLGHLAGGSALGTFCDVL